jgi:hypothetical protein
MKIMITSSISYLLTKEEFDDICDTVIVRLDQQLKLEHHNIIEDAVNKYYTQEDYTTNLTPKKEDYRIFYIATSNKALPSENEVQNILIQHFLTKARHLCMKIHLSINNHSLGANNSSNDFPLLHVRKIIFPSIIEEIYIPHDSIFIGSCDYYQTMLLSKSKKELEIIANICNNFINRTSNIYKVHETFIVKHLITHQGYYYSINASEILTHLQLKKAISQYLLPAIIDWNQRTPVFKEQENQQHEPTKPNYVYKNTPSPEIILAINEDEGQSLDSFLLFKNKYKLEPYKSAIIDFFNILCQQTHTKALKKKHTTDKEYSAISSINTHMFKINNVIYLGFNVHETLEKKANRIKLASLFEQHNNPLDINNMFEHTLFFKKIPNKSGFTTTDFEEHPSPTINMQHQIKKSGHHN